MITNYGELKTEIANFINRSDLTSEIPTFIQMAERRIFDDYRTRFLVSEVKQELVPPDEDTIYSEIPVPSDWLETKAVYYGSDPLDRVSHHNILAERVNQGTPRMFARLGDELLIAPLPQVSQTVTHWYWADYSGALVDDTDTNPVLTKFPSVYLYGSLLETATFISIGDQDAEEKLVVWGKMYDKHLQDAYERYKRGEKTGSRYRTGSTW